MRCTKVLINLKNLESNFKQIKNCLNPDVKICSVVKADAYGHGAVEVSKKLADCKTDFLAVATVEEGEELRAAGITLPILVLSLCTPEEVEELVENKLTPLVFDEEYIDLIENAASRAGKKDFSVHIAVDTGMGRIGCLAEDAVKIARYITDCPHLALGGICTHFAVSDSVTAEDEEYTENQIKAFNFACESVKKEGINPGLRHCSSSAALLNLSGAHFDMVRAGIILYGYYPDQVTKEYLSEKGINVELKKVMSMTTKVVSVRQLKKGKSVSYGHTWTAEEDTELAVLPVGYADGLLRSFARTLKIKIGSKFYEIRGRICMDQCMVEIGKNSGVKRWDDVVLFGDNDCAGCEELVSAQELAETTNTIPYEILTGITKRVPRVYV